ncbi:MAG: peptidase M64 [bacterium]|nr:peptidase M64 [bacterium]
MLASPVVSGTDPVFSHFFHDETLRIDYYHTGNSFEEIISLDQLWRQGMWSGSRLHLLDDLNLGRYYQKVYDAATGELIYSKGFDSYYGEWKTTGPAAEGIRRTYHESALIPFPRNSVEFALEVRQKDKSMKEIYRVKIDPQWHMIREDKLDDDVMVMKAAYNGNPHGCVDIAILGDGYTAEEEGKFRDDVQRFSDLMLGYEPYKSMSQKFNIWGVLKPSQESGCDEPSRGVHLNTALGCTFDSLGSERYMLTEDNRVIRDVAANAPYDVLYIMVNHERYGGGGIYNLFCTFTSDNQWSEFVFLHEFGHSFAGLADEYYSSSTAYNDFYPAGQEPNERNITALVNSSLPKWAHLLTEGTSIPTPWKKAEYDAMDAEYNRGRAEQNRNIANLMKNGGKPQEIAAAKAEGEAWSKSHQARVDEWFRNSEFFGQVGAFEGGGYVSEGMYRSEIDCIMFTKGLKKFCAACTAGIQEITRQYTESD